MAEIVIPEFMDQAAIARYFTGFDVLYDPTLVDRPAELHAALRDARALIVHTRTQVRGALLEAAPELNVVGRLGTGFGNIDVEACRARDIAVCTATGASNLSVAEYVITAALMLLRRTWLATAQVAAGEWPSTQLVGRELADKRIGLVGLGVIARETAGLARNLRMHVSGCDPHVPPDHPAWEHVSRHSLEELLASNDVVSLHVPLTDETRHMIDAEALAHMRRDAILVNAACGGIVDEAALVDALREGRLGGAALDVFESEPVDPQYGARFRDVPNLILTPHIAGVTEESNVRVSAITAEAVLRHLSR